MSDDTTQTAASESASAPTEQASTTTVTSGETAASPEQTTPPAEEPKKTPWFQTRIDQITREKYEERRAREALEAEVRDLRARTSSADTTTQQPNQQFIDPSSIQRLADERANQMLKEQNFNQACNRVYESGKKELGGEFDTAIQNFNMLGGLGAHPALVEAATLLPDGHKILHHLGSNLEEAARIIALPPMQMALAISDIQAKVKSNPISAAPAPIKPLGSTGSTGAAQGPDDDGKFPNQEAYRKWRAQQFKRA